MLGMKASRASLRLFAMRYFVRLGSVGLASWDGFWSLDINDNVSFATTVWTSSAAISEMNIDLEGLSRC